MKTKSIKHIWLKNPASIMLTNEMNIYLRPLVGILLYLETIRGALIKKAWELDKRG